MSTKPETPDHEAVPLSVREGPVDLNAENYRLQVLRHDRARPPARDDGARDGHPAPRPAPNDG